jgi:hypothetical protein
MPNDIRFSSLVLLTSLVACSHAAPTGGPARATTTTPVTIADLRLRLGVLAHDSMLGRDAGQIGNVRATDYIAHEAARLGMQPAGDEGSYFQTIPLVSRAADPQSVLRTGTAELTVGRDFIPLRPIGGTPFGGKFRGERVGVVYGGRIGTANLVDPSAVTGKVVVFLPALGAQFVGTGAPLARYANATMIAIAGLDDLAPQTATTVRTPRVLMVDPAVPQPPSLPGIVLTNAAADRLFGSSLATATVGAEGGTVTGSFSFVDAPTPHPARNVVAIIHGTDAALRGQMVAIGAHSDHVGISATPLDHDSVRAFNVVARPAGLNDPLRQPTPDEIRRIAAIRDSLRGVHPPRLDSIFNGADDDASGSAVVLELAEYFAANPPKRSLLFVWHTAEEKGLFGAAYFTDHPTVPRDSIIAQINLDQVSRGGPADVAGRKPHVLFPLGTRRLSTELGDMAEAVNGALPHPFTFDYVLDAPGHPSNGYCRSDHYMYARYGIPIAFFTAGWHRDYHMVTDEVQYASVETMNDVATFIRELSRRVADLDHRLVVDKPKPDPRGTCRQ